MSGAPNFKLTDFEGPLDLILTLILRNKIDIFEVKITDIIEQYLEFMSLLTEENNDIAAEFIAMAARLINIKSLRLLPASIDDAEVLEDELKGEIIEYAKVKQQAQALHEQASGFNKFTRQYDSFDIDFSYNFNHEKIVLLAAYKAAIGRGERFLPPPVTSFTPIVDKRTVPVSSKILHVLRSLKKGKRTKFLNLFNKNSTKSDVVATFLAVLELLKRERVKVAGAQDNFDVTLI